MGAPHTLQAQFISMIVYAHDFDDLNKSNVHTQSITKSERGVRLNSKVVWRIKLIVSDIFV